MRWWWWLTGYAVTLSLVLYRWPKIRPRASQRIGVPEESVDRVAGVLFAAICLVWPLVLIDEMAWWIFPRRGSDD